MRPDAIFKLPGYIAARSSVEKAVDTAIERHRAGEFSAHNRMWMLDALLATRDDEGNQLGARGIRGEEDGDQAHKGRNDQIEDPDVFVVC